MTMGDRIEARLAELEMSQAELARRVGVTQSTINSMIRKGRRSSPHLVRIAKALQTTPAFLALETDDPDGEADAAALTSLEQELLELFRGIEKREQAAFMTLVRSIATHARSPTVNESGAAFRGKRPQG